MNTSLTRRQFILQLSALAGTAAVSPLFISKNKQPFTISQYEQNSTAGHLLRDGSYRALPFVDEVTQTVDTVIVGGGISGLGAAWKLKKLRHANFILLELGENVGGNSSYGENLVSAYPWGAHYVPIPTKESEHVRELFEELGVLIGYDENGLPQYNKDYLINAPQSHLYRFGRWQDGLLPNGAAFSSHESEYQRFFNLMNEYSMAVGNDGKKAFTIPLELSSQDNTFTKLDALTMSEFLTENSFTSEPLVWYINYCCRDDYGIPIDQLSAWAGIHYFAARIPWATPDTPELLTWPAGNGWIVEQLNGNLSKHIKTASVVTSIMTNTQAGKESFLVEYVSLNDMKRRKILTSNVIYAAPRFTARYTMPAIITDTSYIDAFTYAPWLVANITVSNASEFLSQLAWDSVSYHSKSLGIISSMHQSLKAPLSEAVLTFYQPLDHLPPSEARKQAASKNASDWASDITNDLEKYFPKISELITEINIRLWGHGMIRPVPGFLWGRERSSALSSLGNLHFAHSDMSGISIFEEALYRGFVAAEKVFTGSKK